MVSRQFVFWGGKLEDRNLRRLGGIQLADDPALRHDHDPMRQGQTSGRSDETTRRAMPLAARSRRMR